MSKSELWKGVALRSVVALVFAGIGGAAIVYALEMVSIFGEGMGVDDRSRLIYSRAHMIVHLFAAACALAIGVFVLARSKMLASIALLAVLLCGSYGILNMVGFTSSNRVATAAVKDAKRAAAEREFLLARDAIEKQIVWLGKQTVFADNAREKASMYKEIDAKRKELAALKAPVPTADTVLSDPQATTLGEITHLSARSWALWLPVLLAMLLFYAESASFVFVGHMISGIIALAVAYNASRLVHPPVPPKIQGGTDGTGGTGGTDGGTGGGVPRKFPHPVPSVPASNRSPMRASAPVPAAVPAAVPDKVSNAARRVCGQLADAGSAYNYRPKLSFDEFIETLSHDMAHGEPASSTRALARATGWSPMSVSRHQQKLKGRRFRPFKHHGRFAGNGGGFHASALG